MAMATLFFVLGATFLINNVLAGMSTSYCAQGTGGCHEHFETTHFEDHTGDLSLDECAAKCDELELECKSFSHGKPGVGVGVLSGVDRENWCNIYPVECTSAGDSDWNNYLPASDDRCTHEYEVVQTGGLSRTQAQVYCTTTYGTNLATIWNDADARYLLDTARNTLGGHAWIGLNDVSLPSWLFASRQFDCVKEYGAGGCDAAYPYWHDGEPNDVGANEDCAHVRVEATEIWDMLNDNTCTWTGTSGFFCDSMASPAAHAVGGWSLSDIANSNRGAENYYSNGEYPSWVLYGVVKYTDSDVDQSDALPINV